MKLLTTSQLRFLKLAPWSTFTVFVGVMLGVSSIVAVHQISMRVVAGLEEVTPRYFRSVSHLLEKTDLSMEDYFDLRASWRSGKLPEIVGMMPLIEGQMIVDASSYSIVGLDGLSGVSEVLGLAFLAPGELVVAGQSGYVEGQSIQIGAGEFTIAFSHESVPGGVMLTDIGTAQEVLGWNDNALSRIAVMTRSPPIDLIAWADRLLPGFSAGVVLDEWALPGWRVRSMASELPSLAFARSVLFNLGALGSLALVVAWLLVYQVSVIWLRRRQQTLQRLRQMGVRESELLIGFLVSLLGLGVLASVVGIGVGQLLANLLARSASGYSGAELSMAPDIERWVLIKAVGSAIGVCLVGGWLAFMKESRGSVSVRLQWLLVVILLASCLSGVLISDSLLGGFISIGAASLLVLLGVRPLLEWLRGFSRRLGGGSLLRKVGLRELVWYPGDLAIAVGALALALATSIAIALMVDSFRQDFQQMLDRRLVQDVFVVAEGRDLSELAVQLASRPDVQRVQSYGRIDTRIDGRRVALGYTRFDERESKRYGLDRALGMDECLLSERLARDIGASVGGSLELDEVEFTIAGIFAGFGDTEPRLLMDQESARRLGIRLRMDRLSVTTRSEDALIEALKRMDPTLEVRAGRVLRETAMRVFDQTFAVTQALTLLALIVASVGLYNALLALRLVQQQSLELLVAMGVSASELKTIERWRVVGVGCATLLFALPLGVLMGWLLCQVINPRAFGWSLNLLIDWPSFVWPVASAIAVMALISLLPTPREGLDGDAA
ncbi:MAG: FtsX-like permease family protein [Pseudomonadales bacterium]